MPDQLLTLKDVAAKLRCSDRHVWTFTKAGELPVLRFGRAVRVTPADLEAFIERQRQKTANGEAAK